MEDSENFSFEEDDELFINIGRRRTARELEVLMEISSSIKGIERRQTFSGFSQPKYEFDLNDITDGLSKTSLSSHQLAEDEEIDKHSSPGNFLDKVAEILDVSVSGNTTYTTALETNSANTTKDHENLKDLLNSTSHDIIPMQTFGQSALLDNCEATLYTSLSQQDTITISDDEIDTDFLRYQGTQMKYEDITIEEESDSNDCVILDSTVGGKASTTLQGSVNENEETEASIAASNASICFDDSLADIDKYLMNAAKIRQNDSSLQFAPTEVLQDASFREELLPVDNFKTPTKSSTFKSNIPCKINNKLPSKEMPFKLPQPIKKLQKSHASPYSNIVSPISNYINGALKNTNSRYTPGKTPKSSKTTPINKSNKFDYIASPIATYIKLSNQCGTKRKLEANNQLPIKLPDNLFEDFEKEYDPMSYTIREVIYVPATKQHMTFVHQHKLPNNIKKLIPNIENRITVKHQERLNSDKENRQYIIDKLNNVPDLTVDASILSADNISVLEIRRYT